ncbi:MULTISPECIES: GumC family protein [Croceitalea]|uniref:non-specific protein-tyrosine kinase n=1 Tax=Croceitalea vernalis TaxID=3075599 RepID=A0ABU3BGJ0_9FLAO|nr:MULTISPECIES: polysaccharide biosynthesis tyrosine autokinase [unclassified Croceitalea]MDT0539470.1 polysaccharide biosynthesis tyrosine autokinase [Croceitalea sp. P059]MDT0621262.1 polysaccharide biosynthesis tyrosine autokinase [Croceitalea sp. P007]
MDSNIGLTSNSIDISKIVASYTKHWKWFLLSIVIFVAGGLVYLRYAIPQFANAAKIQILEENGSNPELSLFKDLNFLSGGGNKVEDELEILNSRTSFIEVAYQLGLNVKFFELGNIKDSDLYEDIPFELNFIKADSIINNSKANYFINVTSSNKFEFKEDRDGEKNEFKTYSFGNKIKTLLGDIVVLPKQADVSRLSGKKYKIEVIPLSKIAEFYKKNTAIEQSKEFSNIVNLSLKDPVPDRGRDILNALINNYNDNAIEDKKNVADKTSSFIEDRIAEIYSNLSNVDQSAQDFKTDRGLTDIASQASLNLTVGAENQQELQQVSTQYSIAASMKDYVESQDGYEVLPSNIGLADASIAATTAKWNQLVSQRERLLKSSNEKNPIIVNLDQELNGLKRSLQSSLNSMTNTLNLQVNNLSSQLSRLNSKIYSAPKNERALRDITRKQQTTESLYLYLLQKREESQITFASSTPKSKVIDFAYSDSFDPVSPNKPIILLASILLGFIVPFAGVYVSSLMDNKVHSKTGVEDIVKNIPVLAELPKLERKEAKMVESNDRSILAESFRILRTNLDYLLRTKNSSTHANIVLVTSSIPGEGKTFVSSNLVKILATTKKKVLLIGADIRNPKIYKFYNSSLAKETDSKPRHTNVGLTDYLFDEKFSSKQIIQNIDVGEEKIDVIYSGKIPPNPTELLMKDRFKDLLDEVSDKYDYIVVDSAPVIAVSDTLLISNYVSQVIYVTKAGYTEKRILEVPIQLMKEGKFPNLAFVVNAVKNSDLGYGGKYGYGYGVKQKKWWQLGK